MLFDALKLGIEAGEKVMVGVNKYATDTKHEIPVVEIDERVEEEQIARVAQSYGWKVTAQQVHSDPLKKVYVCQVLGNDNRLKGSCAGYGPENYAPGR